MTDLHIDEVVRNLARVAARFEEKLPAIKNEEATKTALVLPVLAALGWDVFDPNEVQPEYKLEIEGREREAVDYALKLKGRIVAIIECKAAHHDLAAVHETQLRNYYSAVGARLGILTNGIEWRFFTSLHEDGQMDRGAFAIHRLDNPIAVKSILWNRLERDSFTLGGIDDVARETTDRRRIEAFVEQIVVDPPDWFVNDILRHVLGRMGTSAARWKVKPIIQDAMREALGREAPLPLPVEKDVA